MIPLNAPTLEFGFPYNQLRITDTTDYSVGSPFGPYAFSLFQEGLRLIKIVDPSGNVKVYGSFQFVNGPDIDDNIVVNILDTSITPSNNTNASWVFTLDEQGTYSVSILSIPHIIHSSLEDGIYQPNDIYLGGTGDTITLFTQNPPAPPDFIEYGTCGLANNYYVYFNTGERVDRVYPSPYISSKIQEYSTTIFDSITCIFSKYESSFCTGCGCEDICKNKKSNNILKATLLLRELELLEGNEFEYQKKLELYTPIFKILCHCS